MTNISMWGREFTASFEENQVAVATAGFPPATIPFPGVNPVDLRDAVTAVERYCRHAGIEIPVDTGPEEAEGQEEAEVNYWAVDIIKADGSVVETKKFEEPFAEEHAWAFYNNFVCEPGCSKAILEIVDDLEILKRQSTAVVPQPASAS